jgi:hypothetical protein
MPVSLKLRAQLVPSSWPQLLAVLAAAALGLGTWILTMASAPRYSRTGEDGSSWLFVLLLAFALFGGALFFRCSEAIALALGVPGLLMSPFATPRGDNDGLWRLMVPMMVVFTAALVVLAWGAAAVRVRVDPHLSVAVAAQWAPDPYGRHQVRYFDGRTWTGHVADDGRPTFDPLL